MHAMQYNIILPNDYDMNIIRKRVADNGQQTDHFPGLKMKAYLMIDQPQHKEYAPLYLWHQTDGMNHFIFDGFFDNILNSFGWHPIQIAIPLLTDFSETFATARYVVEISSELSTKQQMSRPTFTTSFPETVGKTLVYNPDKWQAVEFHFLKEHPITNNNEKVYQLLHLSE
jgi:hypothetical protein